MLNFKGIVHFMQQKAYGTNASVLAESSTHTTANKISVKPLLRVFALSGILMSCAHAGGKADDYIRTSISKTFDNVNKFECEGGERSAICKIDRYEFSNLDGFALRDYRYTVDYKDERVIERVSGNIEVPYNYDLKVFAPKHFECSDFTQIHNDKQQVNEQLVCSLNSDTYRLKFRLRTKSYAPEFANINSMSLLTKGADFIDRVAKEISSARNINEFSIKADNLKRVLDSINVDVYGVDIALTKLNLPEKIYEHLFGYMDDEDDFASSSSNIVPNLSRTLYNSRVGYVYGGMMGYVWGDDFIDFRTKESLNRLFTVLRDSAMLDSNIRSVYITITNRTNEGFNLGLITNKIMQVARCQFDKNDVVEIMNLFNSSVLNRYRIDVGVGRFK